MALSSFFGGNREKSDEKRSVVAIPVTEIIANRFQPRKVFDDEKIKELARTIHIHGLIQPIVIREYEENRYEIIAGERRFRAVQTLGWDEIPAIVQEMTDKETASAALIENLQREDLTAIEEAQAYQSLLQFNQISQEALAQRVGKSQSFIANKLRLLKLADEVQVAILNKQITERHGRALLALSRAEQERLLSLVVENHMTVKEVEKLVAAKLEPDSGRLKEAVVSDAVKKQPKKKAYKKRPVNSTKMYAKDLRIALNTVEKTLDLLKKAGIDATLQQEETDEHYRMVIEIDKNPREK